MMTMTPPPHALGMQHPARTCARASPHIPCVLHEGAGRGRGVGRGVDREARGVIVIIVRG